MITHEQIVEILEDKTMTDHAGAVVAADTILALINAERNTVIDLNEKARRDEQARLKFLFG